jgi:hypothetical protein
MRTTILIPAVLLAAGCADKLRHDSAFALTSGGETAKVIEPPAQARSQQVKVTVTVTRGSADVFVLPAAAVPAVDDLEVTKDARGKWRAAALAAEAGVTQSATLAASVGANQAYKILVVPSDGAGVAEGSVAVRN